MINSLKSVALISLLVLFSPLLLASNFFTDLKESEVKAIFEAADKSNIAQFVTNSSKKPIPALQILPKSNQPKHLIGPATSCIKLYSCNDGICLVDINAKKYVVSEPILKNQSSKQASFSSCSSYNNLATNADTALPAKNKNADKRKFSWIKVINVKANDSLNIRQTTNYKSLKMGAAPYNGMCLKRYRCKGKWCEIKNQEVTGWVHKRFISKMSEQEQTQCL
jgi:hypothetical protein